MTNREKVLGALPGTSLEVKEKTGLGRSTVCSLLRLLVKRGTVTKNLRWKNSMAYTWVYEAHSDPPREGATTKGEAL